MDRQISSPRIIAEISKETQQRLRRNIPWGMTSHIVRVMIEGLLDLLEKNPAHRDIIIACFMSRDITVIDLLRRVSNEPERPTNNSL